MPADVMIKVQLVSYMSPGWKVVEICVGCMLKRRKTRAGGRGGMLGSRVIVGFSQACNVFPAPSTANEETRALQVSLSLLLQSAQVSRNCLGTSCE